MKNYKKIFIGIIAYGGAAFSAENPFRGMQFQVPNASSISEAYQSAPSSSYYYQARAASENVAQVNQAQNPLKAMQFQAPNASSISGAYRSAPSSAYYYQARAASGNVAQVNQAENPFKAMQFQAPNASSISEAYQSAPSSSYYYHGIYGNVAQAHKETPSRPTHDIHGYGSISLDFPYLSLREEPNQPGWGRPFGCPSWGKQFTTKESALSTYKDRKRSVGEEITADEERFFREEFSAKELHDYDGAFFQYGLWKIASRGDLTENEINFLINGYNLLPSNHLALNRARHQTHQPVARYAAQNASIWPSELSFIGDGLTVESMRSLLHALRTINKSSNRIIDAMYFERKDLTPEEVDYFSSPLFMGTKVEVLMDDYRKIQSSR